MSKSASIHLVCSGKYHPRRVVQELVQDGWNYDFFGHILFIPPGSNDFDWTAYEIDTWEQRLSEIDQKYEDQHLIGLGLLWKDSDTGITLHFQPANQIMIMMTEQRPMTFAGMPLCDFNWFLERIVPSFLRSGLEINALSLHQESS